MLHLLRERLNGNVHTSREQQSGKIAYQQLDVR